MRTFYYYGFGDEVVLGSSILIEEMDGTYTLTFSQDSFDEYFREIKIVKRVEIIREEESFTPEEYCGIITKTIKIEFKLKNCFNDGRYCDWFQLN